MLEWILWRLPVKARFAKTEGLRERVLQSRPKNPKPPRSFYRRFRVNEIVQNGHKIFTLSPRKRPASLHVLYLHGGAYVYEIMGTQWKLMAQLLKRLDLSITIPLYPLAPEHTCPEVLEFTRNVYSAVLAQADGMPVVVLGDSAGGGMAVALSQQLRDSGGQQPAGLVLLSPWLDVTCSDPSQPALDKVDPLLAMPGLREEGSWYAGDLSPTDQAVSPLFGDLSDLPPMLAFTGTHDLLNADAHRLQAKMAEMTSSLTAREYKDMLHVWPSMPIPEASEALDEIAVYLRGLTRM